MVPSSKEISRTAKLKEKGQSSSQMATATSGNGRTTKCTDQACGITLKNKQSAKASGLTANDIRGSLQPSKRMCQLFSKGARA